MQEKDVKLLWMFTLRIAMYTGKVTKETISSFLTGYEIGRDNQCDFTIQMVNLLEKDYKIERRAAGLQGQIERLADILETDWVTTFKKLSLIVLTKEFNMPIEREIVDSYKKRIAGKIGGLKNHFRKDWVTDWFGIVDLEANWFLELWSENELNLITSIEQELILLGDTRVINDKIEPTENLKNLCLELYKEIKRNKS